MAALDLYLRNKYKESLNINNFIVNENNSVELNGNFTFDEIKYVQEIKGMGNLSVSSLSVTNDIFCNSNTIGVPNITTNSFVCNKMKTSSLTGNTLLSNNNVCNDLYISGVATINTIDSNNCIGPYITCSNISSSSITLSADKIIIGTETDNITILGNINSYVVSNLQINDNVIHVNHENGNSGNSSGIEISGSTMGFIKTNLDNTDYIIKTPNNSLTEMNILLIDDSKNIFITGNTTIKNKLSCLSNLNINSTLDIDTLTVNNILHNNGLLNVQNRLFCNDDITGNNFHTNTLNNTLLISNDVISDNIVTTMNILNSDNCIIKGNNTSENIKTDSINGQINCSYTNVLTTNFINLNSITSNSIWANNIEVTNTLTGISFVNNDSSNNVFNTCQLNKNNNIVGKCLYNNITVNSNIILGKNVIINPKEYLSNDDAKSISGIGTFYRIGNSLNVIV